MKSTDPSNYNVEGFGLPFLFVARARLQLHLGPQVVRAAAGQKKRDRINFHPYPNNLLMLTAAMHPSLIAVTTCLTSLRRQSPTA